MELSSSEMEASAALARLSALAALLLARLRTSDEVRVKERIRTNDREQARPAAAHRFLLVPSSRKPLANGLWSIFSLVI